MNKIYPQPPKSVIRFFFQIVSPHKWWYFLVLLGPLSLGIYPLFQTYALKLIVNSIADDNFLKITFLHPIFWYVYAEIYLQASWRVHNFASWQFLPYMYREITDRVFARVINYPYKFFQENLSGSLISKIKGINDGLYKIHSGIEGNVSVNVIKLISSAIALGFVNLDIFLIVLAFVIIKFPLNIYTSKKLADIDEDCQKDWYSLFGMVSDNITNIFNIFAFAKKNKERQKIWDYYTNTHIPKRLLWWKYDFYSCLLLTIFEVVFMAVMCYYIIHLKKLGEITAGDITFILITVSTFLESVWRSFSDIKDFLQRLAQAQAAYSVMLEPQDEEDIQIKRELIVCRGSIEFKNISFAYDSNVVFKNLSIKISAGEKVGIIGTSGVGKSTLVSLLMKNFKPNSGKIFVDDQNIYEFSSDSLRAQIGYIPQDIILFHRSIKENIAYAKDFYTQDEVTIAARDASVHDFIMTLPEKYDTLVGERGIKLSGGQRQRIAIARAFLKNAPILILDEATSALDSITEREIQKSLWKLMQNKTCIVIAHRLSTLVDMDRILVFDGGKIVEEGNHKKLILKNGIYKKLWETQFKIG